MRAIHRFVSRLSIDHCAKNHPTFNAPLPFSLLVKPFSSSPPRNNDKSTSSHWCSSFGVSSGEGGDNLIWDVPSSSSWSTGLTEEHFDGEIVGHQVSPGIGPNPPGFNYRSGARGHGGRDNGGNGMGPARWTDNEVMHMKRLVAENRKSKAFVERGWERTKETSVLMKQVREPGARGSYLKDSEKAEMYRKHKENPEAYTVEKLAKEYRVMRQRVHAILWLKEQEEEEEKTLGQKLDDSVEVLLDTFPE